MKAKITTTKKKFQRALIFVEGGEITLVGITKNHKDVAKVHCRKENALPLAHAFARYAHHSLVFPVNYFLGKVHKN